MTRAGVLVDSWPPTPGFYTIVPVRGGHTLPVRIWFGAPYDPDTEAVLDRSPRWQALWNGWEVDVHRVWPQCQNSAITFSAYSELLRLNQSRPHIRFFDPIDLLQTKITF